MGNELKDFYLKCIKSNVLVKTGIRGITKKKLQLFNEELSLLEKIEVTDKLRNVIRYLENIVNDAKYIRFADFKGTYKSTIEEINKIKAMNDYTRFYSNLVEQAYQCCELKIKNIKKLGIREPEAKDVFWILFLCYIFNLFKAYSENILVKELNMGTSDDAYRRIIELVESYNNDFIMPFSYIRRKPHIILRGNDSNIVSSLKRVFDENIRDSLYEAYWVLKNRLHDEDYPYDISKPVLRKSYRNVFNKKWDSVIITIYPVSIEKLASHIDTDFGHDYLRLRLHTTIYLELLVDMEGIEYMVFSNKDIRSLRDNERRAVEEVLREIFNINYNDLLGRSRAYKANTALIVDKINQSILEGPNATEKVIAEFKQELLDKVNDSSLALTHKDVIANFIKSMNLVGVELHVVKKKRKLAILKAEIGDVTPLGSGRVEKEVLDKAKPIFNSFKEFKEYYKPLEADVRLSLEFQGEIGERKASIIIDREGIVYNNMSRDIVSELAYVVSEVLRGS